jgi:hypothetical protein
MRDEEKTKRQLIDELVSVRKCTVRRILSDGLGMDEG